MAWSEERERAFIARAAARPSQELDSSLVAAFRRLVRDVAPDVIHSHFVGTTLTMRWALGANSTIPRVFQVPGPLHLEHPLYRRAEISSAGTADYWIGSCRWTCDEYSNDGKHKEKTEADLAGRPGDSVPITFHLDDDPAHLVVERLRPLPGERVQGLHEGEVAPAPRRPLHGDGIADDDVLAEEALEEARRVRADHASLVRGRRGRERREMVLELEQQPSRYVAGLGVEVGTLLHTRCIVAASSHRTFGSREVKEVSMADEPLSPS